MVRPRCHGGLPRVGVWAHVTRVETVGLWLTFPGRQLQQSPGWKKKKKRKEKRREEKRREEKRREEKKRKEEKKEEKKIKGQTLKTFEDKILLKQCRQKGGEPCVYLRDI